MILTTTKSFRRDLHRLYARNYDMGKLDAAVDDLRKGHILDARYQDHALHGKQSHLRECHIEFDWLLVYRLRDDEVTLVRTGTHADIFGK